ncbi:penicillin-binding protein 2 [Ruminococcus sp. YRD2003]|uniref:penicillin-binding transpeptidase domain-containing protein n=1 Tax=Ruminococcus sp. YRD2003 TaxID=1452313 RepID=UPI0008C0C8AA|nr:penicillin-binding protein 2 [Ruminococcus flavefaciens]
MKSITDNIKSIIIVTIVVLLGTFASMRLMKIQVVGSENIVTHKTYGSDALTYVREITPTRGEILDFNGNVLVENTTRCDLVLRKAFFTEDIAEGNSCLLEIYKALLEHGYEFEDTLPITKTMPYEFTKEDVAEMVGSLNLNPYATAENCIDKLISDYKIDESYSPDEKRIIAGMRYTMMDKDFSYSLDLVLAKNVDHQTVIDMKELGNFCRGIEAVDAAEREIVRGDILPHEIGVIGPIYAEEYDDLKDKGYAMNDYVGKSGIELAMEKELRGKAGTEEVTVVDGAIVDVKTREETVPGESVKLTVDGAYQLKLQGILDKFLKDRPFYNGNKVNKGALVVLDAKTGAVKGMATAPTYNLKDMTEDYESLVKAENSPMFNRCTWGQYLPGSTFKTVTATAGLNEGVITGNSTFNCTRNYEFYGGKFQCTGYHGAISVRRAIEVSCNIFFYETSRNLGIDNITKYAKLYGLGSSTGIETGDAAGFLCNPETFAERGEPWYIGYVIQAGIGNQACGFTPLQLANVAATIGNRGVRYQPYLVDSLYTYGSNELVKKTKPTVADEIDLNYDYVYDYIIDGMIDAARACPAPYQLTDLGFSVAIKTGTPQTDMNDKNKQNSVFIGFAPADDPEIAFAGVIEGGEYSKYMIRDIILSYQQCYGLNGVKPTAQLPAEVRNGTTAAAAAATTTSSNTAVTSTTATTSTTAVPAQ